MIPENRNEETPHRRRADRPPPLTPATPPETDEPPAQQTPPSLGTNYLVRDGHFYLGGEKPRQIANFTAHIVRELIHDDGVSQTRQYEISVHLPEGRELSPIIVLVEDFQKMSWVGEKVGSKAIINVGMRDHLRAAIQIVSPDVEQCCIYSHTGFRKIDGGWCYLHAGGAIGADGPIPAITTVLPEALGRFVLPTPPDQDELAAAFRTSLELLDLAPDRLMVPLVASAFRAVLGEADFTTLLVGSTGIFKSQVAALIQQHFGAEMVSAHLPANWSSTANSLESLCFHAKDTVIVVDDFVPGNHQGRNPMQAAAERLIRAEGNASGRQRMSPDGTLRLTKPPRGLIFATGEEVPLGESLRGRMFILPVSSGDVDVVCLTQSQEQAAQGAYAKSMSGFISRIAGQYDEVQKRMRERLPELRREFQLKGVHNRTPGIAASLMFSLELFLEFALECEAISKTESDKLRIRFKAAILEAVEQQHNTQRQADPLDRFFSLIDCELSTGRAYLRPITPHRPGTLESGSQVARGMQIGWIHGRDIYLDKNAAFAEACKLAREQGEDFPISLSALCQRIDQAGKLVKEASQNTLLHRLPSPLRGTRALRLAPGVLEWSGGPVMEVSPEQSAAQEESEPPHAPPRRCPVGKERRRSSPRLGE